MFENFLKLAEIFLGKIFSKSVVGCNCPFKLIAPDNNFLLKK